jgi:hypothetical protein
MSKKNPENPLEFGENIEKNMQVHLLTKTAKACYIMSRPILNSHMLLYYPASFFVMHHSLECFIKAFLLAEDIAYVYWQTWHKIEYLLNLGKGNKNLEFFQEILNNPIIINLLNSLTDNYNPNRYWEVGFNWKIKSIIDIFDKLISIFTNQFHILYENKRVEASIDVPNELADLMEKDRNYPITLCIWPEE